MQTSAMDARHRNAALAAATSEVFDLVVVGGGINGAGIAHDAALRGLRVLLVEQRDLAFGTSSRSSKLIHGGLRYLEHYHFRLVFEGTNERALLRRVAPHLVRPLLFALPVYEGDRHPLWKIQVGMWMYDGLALFKAEHRHIALRSAKRLLEREPLLRAEGLTGGIIYYDCVTDDARLTLENTIAATRSGATVLTRARVVALDDLPASRQPARVTLRDELSGRELVVRGRAIINATGPWVDRTRAAARLESHLLRPTKGVHVVLPRDRLQVHHATALIAPQDGRVFFAIPWNGRTVIGTTDTDEGGNPSELKVEKSDVQYLLSAANHAFPTARLDERDVISTWVGLRPLVKEDSGSASDVSREHQLFRDGRLISLAGGKLTTYRRMAKETVDAAVEVLGTACQDSSTAEVRLPGAIGLGDLEALQAELVSRVQLPVDVAARLAGVYGSRAWEVVAVLQQDPRLVERISPDRDAIMAEVVHAMNTEIALTVDDVLVRRTSIALTAADQGRGAAERVADLMGRHLGWDAATRQKHLDELSHTLDLNNAFRRAPERSAEANAARG